MSSSIPGLNTVDVDSITFRQFSTLKDDLDLEIEQLSNVLCDLNKAKHVVEQGLNTLKTLQLLSASHKITCICPVTENMFFRGVIQKTDVLLVHIGDGYYAEMPLDDARNFYLRKRKDLKARLEGVQGTAQEKLYKRYELEEGIAAKLEEAMKDATEEQQND